jgi:Spy/CpxP family protein refolding chaperone
MNSKLTKIRLIAAVALGALAAGSLAASAQSTNSAPHAGAGQGDRGAQIKERLQRVAEELQLTDAQKEEIKPVLKEEFEKVRDIRADTSLEPKERRKKMKAVRDDIAGKFKSILTPEQFEKWQKLQAERRAKRQPSN